LWGVKVLDGCRALRYWMVEGVVLRYWMDGVLRYWMVVGC